MNKVRIKILKKLGKIASVLALLSFVVVFFDVGSFMYKASVLDLPAHMPFDGTVYPIEKSPDWVHMGDKWDYSYNELSAKDFQDLPYYDAEQLKQSTDNLEWGNSDHDLIRNAKITYSTPYMGSYLLDGIEYSGSHLAVDIKIPTGTPILAIANGTVSKVSSQSSGFGQHVVLVHNNVPGESGPIYSSYSHNSENLVSVGDTVAKGQKIALSGDSGTATTPHLHFQIDNDDAPWHPFWPFTWSEASEAGYSFFEAVNAGLGQAKGIATTLHPLEFVQTHLDSSAAVSVVVLETDEEIGHEAVSYVSDTSDILEIEEEPVEEVVEEEAVMEIEEVVVEEIEELPVEIVVEDPPVLQFEFEMEDMYEAGGKGKFILAMKDQYGDYYTDAFAGEIVVTSVQNNVRVKDPIIKWSYFGGVARLSKSFSKLSHGRDRLKVVYDGKTYYSKWFNIYDEEKGFADVSEKHKYYEAIMYLRDKDVVAGYDDGTYKSQKVVSRVEASKFIVSAAELKLKNSGVDYPFPDVTDDAWYLDYVFTLYKNGAISGNDDGTLRPDNDVNQAEFLKMLFLAMDEDVPDAEDGEAWYVPYIETAKELGIISKGNPGKGMTRGEVANAMWKVMTL